MNVLILGSGLVGATLAAKLQEAGHTAAVTTTTPEKVAQLQAVTPRVHVLRGADRDAVAAAAEGVDAIVVTAGPSAQKAMTRADREASYHEILVETAQSVVASSDTAHLVFCSSLSVYGDQADHLDEITEDAPRTKSDDPSPVKFQEAEDTYLQAADRATIFRCADIYGGPEIPLEAKVKMAHEMLGGSVPFQGKALFYRVHVDDVAGAIAHALLGRHTGVFNLTHPDVPPTNAAMFDAISAAQGYPPLECRDELAGPGKPVSVKALLDTGYQFTATEVAELP